MRKIIAFSILFILLAPFFVNNSFAQFAPREHPSLYQVSLQLALRDSEGNLVSYVEPSHMFIRNILWTHEFLDSVENKKMITIDGKTYEQIQFKKTEHFNKEGQKTAYGLSYKGTHVLLLMHDAYIAQPGDSLSVSWNIIRVPQ